jgi:hypothetical protein
MEWNNENAGSSSGLNPVEEDVAGIQLQWETELTGQSGTEVWTSASRMARRENIQAT